MHLSEIGQIASKIWLEIPVHFPFIGLDAFVVMPDHIHGIIVINSSVRTPIESVSKGWFSDLYLCVTL
jgi:REP-associated tyrosine transposase